MSIDQIYASKQEVIKSFQFDQKVAEVFDDMLGRSIPFYSEIHHILVDIYRRLASELPAGHIYDIGCSTGETLSILSQVISKQHSLIGIDPSQAMIDKAHQKLSQKKINPAVQLITATAQEIEFDPAAVILMHYTLQFIPLQERDLLLQKIYHSLRPGGIFLLAEKLKCTSKKIDQLTTNLYYDFKRRNGYSEIEISQKREALENVLVPVSTSRQLAMLREAGFENTEVIFRWYNFAYYIAIK